MLNELMNANKCENEHINAKMKVLQHLKRKTLPRTPTTGIQCCCVNH